MNTLVGTMDLSRAVFEGFESHWKSGGIWRPSYSPEENEAIKIIANHAAAMGMTAYQDLAGNAYFVFKGEDSSLPIFMTGSHVDAVPQGGRYDGTAGVVAGLAALKKLQDDGRFPPQDTVLTVIRSEESAWFNSALLGSRLACGDVDPKVLLNVRNHSDENLYENLYTHMTRIGLSPAELTIEMQGKHALIPLEKIGAFIEVHIEQGPSLLSSGHDLGIVTGIRGNARCPEMIEFYGEAAHSGATPQYMRRDTVIGAAEYISRLNKIFNEKAADGFDIVWAFPQIETPSGSPTTIPQFCKVQPEVRSLDLEVLKWAKEKFQTTAISVCGDLGLGWSDKNLSNILISPPSQMNPDFINQLEVISGMFNFRSTRLPSGAGHDAGTFARFGVPSGMIFIPHGNRGISHNPAEIMGMTPEEDPFSLTGGFAKAVTVLAEAMMKPLANKQGSNSRFTDGLQPLALA